MRDASANPGGSIVPVLYLPVVLWSTGVDSEVATQTAACRKGTTREWPLGTVVLCHQASFSF